MKIRKTIFYIVVLSIMQMIFLQGCINLKSDYPEISYYKLMQPSLSQIHSRPVDAMMFVRDFTISSEYKTDRFIATDKGIPLKFYYYHRWLTDCDELITDFIIHRLSSYNLFSEGIKTGNSVVAPDYYLEGRIFEMLAHNNDETSDKPNYITLEIKIELIKSEMSSGGKKVVLSKIYKKKVFRKNNKADSIPAAFSIAAAEITDELLSDILSLFSK